MNPDEIIRALRENADWCDANEYEIPLCMGDNQWEAADLIESLQAQLAESQRRERAAVEDMEIFKVHSQAIGKLSSCNDCMLAKDCVVKPGIGEWVRINCHLWRGFSEKGV